MARIEPLASTDLAEHEEGLALVEQMMGFVPNSMPTMARVPGLLAAFQGLGAAVFGNGLIPVPLAQMVAHVASTAAGCQYCQAHTGHTAERMGVPAEKLAVIWAYETSDLFDEAERAALRIAQAGGSVPNSATDEMFNDARAFYTDDQLAAIVAVMSMFGYLNRWNDTLATTLESSPTAFGEKVLADRGWTPGNHRSLTH